MLYVGNPKGVGRADQRQVIDAVNGLNTIRNGLVDDPEIATKISQYEMAFRMQASVPELVDLKGESKETLEMYGATPGDGSFASNCLLARRLAERGVRFIQLYHRGWDHHGGVKNGVATTAKLVDQASWALVNDLKQRGMLEDTLVIWGGEFGRTPMWGGRWSESDQKYPDLRKDGKAINGEELCRSSAMPDGGFRWERGATGRYEDGGRTSQGWLGCRWGGK